jgi:hypothetical protein
MAISANANMTAKVFMVALSRPIEARSVKHRGEKRKFHFGMPGHESTSRAALSGMTRLDLRNGGLLATTLPPP